MTKFHSFQNLPLFGFDQLFSTVEKMANSFNLPYDIRFVEENVAEVRIAVAGFSKDELKVTKDDDILVVHGSIETDSSTDSEYPKYLHKGISGRPFTFKLPIHEHYKVNKVKLVDGILTVSLQKEVPEEKRPVKFDIE